MHFASDPALANLRVSGFLQAASALLFFAAGATPDKSCFFFKGAGGSSISATAAVDEDLDGDSFVVVDAAGTTAAADRDGRVKGPARKECKYHK